MGSVNKDMLQFYFNTQDLKKLIDTDPSAVIVSLELKIDEKTKLITAVITAEAEKLIGLESKADDEIVVYGCPTPPGCGKPE